MKKLFTLFILLFVIQIKSQNVDLSAYKYIVVASNFGFLKSADEYQTSSLTKFLLQKKGFEVLLDNEEFPSELKENGCLALKANVLDNSNMFTTKNFVQFLDCSGKIIYTSQNGLSREKDYKKAYHEAIRNAFDTMTDFTYSYKPNTKNVTYNIDTVQFDNTTVKPKEVVTINQTAKEKFSYSFSTQENGFQILDNENNILFTALKSSLENVYILKNKDGLIYKKDGVFIAEYYENNELKSALFKAPF